jgi:hypothetical protein
MSFPQVEVSKQAAKVVRMDTQKARRPAWLFSARSNARTDELAKAGGAIKKPPAFFERRARKYSRQ